MQCSQGLRWNAAAVVTKVNALACATKLGGSSRDWEIRAEEAGQRTTGYGTSTAFLVQW